MSQPLYCFIHAENIRTFPVEKGDFKGQIYRGMASVGKNVTFDGKELRFEVNLFDFSGDIYGHTLTIHWLDKIREMVKFDGIDQLVAQLKEDEAISRNWTKRVGQKSVIR